MVARPIVVRCREIGGIGRSHEISERRVWAHGVKVGNPGRDIGAGVVEIEEQRLIEVLVAHAAVKALHKAVLNRLSGCDEVPVDTIVTALGEQDVAGVFRALVADDHAELAVPLNDCWQILRPQVNLVGPASTNERHFASRLASPARRPCRSCSSAHRRRAPRPVRHWHPCCPNQWPSPWSYPVRRQIN